MTKIARTPLVISRAKPEGALLHQFEPDLERVIPVRQFGDGRDLRGTLPGEGCALFEESQELIGREEHLAAAGSRLERARHREVFQLFAEGQRDGLFAIADFVIATQRQAHHVAGESIVFRIEGKGSDTGLDTEFGKGVVDFRLYLGGHCGTGQVRQQVAALALTHTDGRTVVGIGPVEGNRCGIDDIAEASEHIVDGFISCKGSEDVAKPLRRSGEAHSRRKGDNGKQSFHNMIRLFD